MNENNYVFDKREIKPLIKKYGMLMLFLCLPVLVLINFLLANTVKGWLIILIDVVVALTIILISDIIIFKIASKKQERKKEESTAYDKILKNRSNKQSKNK